mmetsp:Transcript_16911/g.23427  ORF Transcript_16911/g.23427 Transcript_16911/m.23427 type:complete len:562 (+) Transcript_16911:61-1746(+)
MQTALAPAPQQKAQTILGINGVRTTGEDVREENVTAALAVANLVRSSLGPVGLDKMLVDEVGEVTVTNDGATLLRKMEVEHPAGCMLVELAKQQDEEVGDGTTSVVLLAAELLRNAQSLIRHHIHPTSIITGYKIAMRESIRIITEKLCTPIKAENKELLLSIAHTSLASKILGHADPNVFAHIVVDAVTSVRTVDEDTGDLKFPRKAIGILKQHGKSLTESTLIRGYALSGSRVSQGMPTRVSTARLALLDFDLRAVKLRLGISATIHDPSKAEDMRRRELDITRERVRKILASGANVILTSCGMEDAIQKILVDAGAMGLRRVPKEDLRRIARVTGAKICTTMCDLEGGETFSSSDLGTAASVSEIRFGEDECVVIEGTTGCAAASILLRGSSSLTLDEGERALNDALCVVSKALETGSVVAGGGAVEGYLHGYLEAFAQSLNSREQIAIASFAEALLIIPKQLALNAALDAPDLVAKLRTQHAIAFEPVQTPSSKSMHSGLDLQGNCLRNNMQAGVVEPRASKIKALQLATEAAVTILRIDDCVRLNPPPEPEDPRRR